MIVLAGQYGTIYRPIYDPQVPAWYGTRGRRRINFDIIDEAAHENAIKTPTFLSRR
jgi:hypothetical protein